MSDAACLGISESCDRVSRTVIDEAGFFLGGTTNVEEPWLVCLLPIIALRNEYKCNGLHTEQM